MSIAAAIDFFRREERALMDSSVTAVRDNGAPTLNTTTGVVTQPETTVYTGDALVRQAAWQGSDVNAGETELRLRPWRLKFPHGTNLRRDDRVTVTASANSGLVGRVFRITDFFGDDWSPSAPYFAEEVIGPGEGS